MSTGTSDLFRGLPTEDLDALLALGVPRHLPEGEVLFRLGDEAGAIYLVETGQVHLTLPIRLEGREEDFLVEERGDGQLLGWSGLVEPYRFTLQAKARVDTKLVAFSRSDLLPLFSRRPEVASLVYSNLARIVGQRLQVFQAMWLRAVQQRVASQKV